MGALLDIVSIVILVACVWSAARRGFIKTIIGLVGTLAAVVLASAFGPAAASFDGALRYAQAASLTEWLAGAPPELDEIPGAARLNEIFAVNLRTTSGWTPHLWSRVPGADGGEARLRLVRSAAKEPSPEFFDISPGRITLSSSGLLFWNTIAEVLL